VLNVLDQLEEIKSIDATVADAIAPASLAGVRNRQQDSLAGI